MVEEDGDEIFVAIKDARCCGKKLRAIDGFWRCPACNLSYGEAASTKRKTTNEKPERPWYEWT
jgi:hypothetical protein